LTLFKESKDFKAVALEHIYPEIKNETKINEKMMESSVE
jgi:hypothetical protein